MEQIPLTGHKAWLRQIAILLTSPWELQDMYRSALRVHSRQITDENVPQIQIPMHPIPSYFPDKHFSLCPKSNRSLQTSCNQFLNLTKVLFSCCWNPCVTLLGQNILLHYYCGAFLSTAKNLKPIYRTCYWNKSLYHLDWYDSLNNLQ